MAWSGSAHKNRGTSTCPGTIRMRLVVLGNQVSGGARSQGYGSVVSGRIDADGAIEGRATSWGGMFKLVGVFADGEMTGEVVHPDDCRYPFALTRTAR